MGGLGGKGVGGKGVGGRVGDKFCRPRLCHEIWQAPESKFSANFFIMGAEGGRLRGVGVGVEWGRGGSERGE